jgi:hypothetical protein
LVFRSSIEREQVPRLSRQGGDESLARCASGGLQGLKLIIPLAAENFLSGLRALALLCYIIMLFLSLFCIGDFGISVQSGVLFLRMARYYSLFANMVV